MSYITPIQRGFAPTRNLTNNIPDLDAAARADGRSEFATQIPISLFWDFLTAFPSLAHDFVFLLLSIIQVHEDFLNVLSVLYLGVTAVEPSGTSLVIVYVILSGVLVCSVLSISTPFCA